MEIIGNRKKHSRNHDIINILGNVRFSLVTSRGSQFKTSPLWCFPSCSHHFPRCNHMSNLTQAECNVGTSAIDPGFLSLFLFNFPSFPTKKKQQQMLGFKKKNSILLCSLRHLNPSEAHIPVAMVLSHQVFVILF